MAVRDNSENKIPEVTRVGRNKQQYEKAVLEQTNKVLEQYGLTEYARMERFARITIEAMIRADEDYSIEDFVQILTNVRRKNEFLDAVDDDMVQTEYATFDEWPATDLEPLISRLLATFQE